jgi:glycerol-3-phosphate cytidylyltransferase-like family protein
MSDISRYRTIKKYEISKIVNEIISQHPISFYYHFKELENDLVALADDLKDKQNFITKVRELYNAKI